MIDKESIQKTKKSFEESFRSSSYYNRQTNDQAHLDLILNYIPVKSGMKILDLGTGTGFLAFPFAKKYISADIVGLDIVEQTLEKNQKLAKSNKIKNLRFVSYDGIDFPFDNDSFDIVITRYALHHFPSIENTFREISRVLKKNGLFFLSDPAPNDDDTEHFVDAYMQMKKDGHIKFYTKDEWIELGKKLDLEYSCDVETQIRFPRKISESTEFEDIIKRHRKDVICGYDIEILNDEIWITEKVNNILFRKAFLNR